MPDGEGTVIGWSATFDPMVPGTGRIMVAVVRRLMHGFATSVAAYAGGAGQPGARPGSG
jgi:hypothetical protein